MYTKGITSIKFCCPALTQLKVPPTLLDVSTIKLTDFTHLEKSLKILVHTSSIPAGTNDILGTQTFIHCPSISYTYTRHVCEGN